MKPPSFPELLHLNEREWSKIENHLLYRVVVLLVVVGKQTCIRASHVYR